MTTTRPTIAVPVLPARAEPWTEIAPGGTVVHYDPLRGWQPGPAPELHHRQCRTRTAAEALAIAERAEAEYAGMSW